MGKGAGVWEHFCGHLRTQRSRDDGTRNGPLGMLSKVAEMTNGGTEKNYKNKLGRRE